MLAIINEAFGWLKDFSSSPWFYLIIFAIAVLDSVLPIVPSETLVIIGGVSAGLGNLWIPLVIVVAATGAFIGDNLSYFIGREASDWVTRRQTRTNKGAARMAKIVEQVHERGGLLLITARFIPVALHSRCRVVSPNSHDAGSSAGRLWQQSSGVTMRHYWGSLAESLSKTTTHWLSSSLLFQRSASHWLSNSCAGC